MSHGNGNSGSPGNLGFRGNRLRIDYRTGRSGVCCSNYMNTKPGVHKSPRCLGCAETADIRDLYRVLYDFISGIKDNTRGSLCNRNTA